MTNKMTVKICWRRMNVARSSFTRIVGCYVDKDGDFDGSFNVNLKLSAAEKKKTLSCYRVLFAATNVNLKRYEFDLLLQKELPWQAQCFSSFLRRTALKKFTLKLPSKSPSLSAYITSRNPCKRTPGNIHPPGQRQHIFTVDFVGHGFLLCIRKMFFLFYHSICYTQQKK